MSTLSVQLDWGISCLGDRVQMEQALRRSQSSLAEAQRIAHVGSWEFDLASQSMTWSVELFRIYGLDSTQPAPGYDQWRQTIPLADWPRLQATIERSIATGAAFEVEHRIKRSDGAVRYILARGEAVYNDQGQVVQLRGTAQDCTDARLAAIALEHSEARNRAILSVLPDLIIVISAEGQCLDFSVNGFTGDLVPLVAQEPVGTYVTDALPAEVARQWLEAIAQTLATNTTQFFEQQLSFGDRTQSEAVRMVPYQTDQVLVLVRDISDRKRAEAALQHSQDQLSLALNLGQMAVWTWDAVADRITWSDMAYDLLDQSAGSLDRTYQDWLAAVHPDDRAASHAAIEQALANRQPFAIEYRVLWSDGTQRWIADRGQAIYSEGGEILRAAGVMYDITPRKAAELERQEREAQIQAIAVNVPGFLYRLVIDAQGNFTLPYISDGVEALFGLPMAFVQANPKAALNRIHADDLPQVRAFIAASCARSTPARMEYRVPLANGKLSWVRNAYQAHHTDDGCTVLDGICVDIGDLKQLEQEQRQAEAALQTSATRFRELAETVREGFFVFDALTLRYEYINPAYAAITGVDLETIEDQEQWLTRVHPDDRDRVIALTAQELQGEAIDCEYRFLHSSGELRWLRCRGFPIADDAGVVVRIVGTVDDITSLKQAELGLKRFNEDLEQRVKQRTQELQTLAAVVENSTDLIGIASLSGDSIYMNRAGRDLLGLADDPLEDRPITSFLEAKAVAQFEHETMSTFMATGVWRGETTFCHNQSGEAIAMEHAMFLVQDPETHVPLCIATIGRDIRDRKRSEAKRKQAELALQESEARFRQIAETIQEVFWLATVDASQILYVSPGFEQTWGLPCEVLYQSPEVWLDSIHPDDRPAVEATLRPTSTTPFDKTYRIYRADGELRWIHDRAFPICNQAGEIDRIIGVSNDITERFQAELSLKASEERFRGTFEQAALGIIEADLDGHIVRVNQGLCQLLGYSVAALLSKTYMDLTHPDDLEIDRAQVRRLLNGECTSFSLEKRYLRADGAVVWVSLAVSLVRDGLGTPTYLLGVVHDISEQRAALRERKQAENQLQEQEQFLRSIYEGVNQPICVSEIAIDGTVSVLGLNPAAAALLGKTSASVANESLEAVFGPTEAANILQRYRYCIETNQPITFERSIMVGGQVHWLLGTYNPIADAAGRVYRIVGSLYDITDRKRTEEALKNLNQELEQRVQERTWELEQAVAISEAASRAKSTFLANMSHELRTPLNAILGFAQLMARDTALSNDHHQSLRIVNRSGEHLLMLINDILEMAKIEAGQVNLNVSCFDLDALLSTLNDMFYLRAQDKGLALSIDCHPALPRYFSLDVAKLRQVLINLVGNAIKFTTQGQVTLRVAPTYAIAAAPPPGTTLTVTFSISDTGIGLATGDRDRLFEPFVQASQGAIGGTGLGLSISRQFVQMLGGDITVESAPGQGATFAFTLPMPVAEPENAAAPPPRAQVIALAAGQPHYRLLVVDDNDDHRYLLSQLLQSVGFEVREATNGEEAIALWQSWQPQLIWLDMRMPVLNGYEAAQAIRNQEQGMAQTPTIIIALTANAFEDDRARAIDNGCDDFVRKPFEANHLLAKITEHLSVQYTYGSPTPTPSGPQPLSNPEAIALLRTLSSSMLDQMQQATLQLDSDQLTQIMAQFTPAQTPLATWLNQQINDFAFDTIHDLIQQAKSEA
jgi:PAS domain S-box-containing protein